MHRNNHLVYIDEIIIISSCVYWSLYLSVVQSKQLKHEGELGYVSYCISTCPANISRGVSYQ